MEKLKKIEINNFTLSYNGMFRLAFNYEGENFQKPIYLNPMELFQIIENEANLKNNLDEQNPTINVVGVEIKNTTLILQAWIKNDKITGFLTSAIAEDYQDKGYYLLECNAKR